MSTKLHALMAAVLLLEGHCAIKVAIFHALPEDLEASNIFKQLLQIQLGIAISTKT